MAPLLNRKGKNTFYFSGTKDGDSKKFSIVLHILMSMKIQIVF